MPFLAELIKLIATVAWTVARGRQGELFRGNSWQKWRVYAVLAFIYMLINNIVFLALLQLSPISFIALGNLKTVTTAIFFRGARWLAKCGVRAPRHQTPASLAHTICISPQPQHTLGVEPRAAQSAYAPFRALLAASVQTIRPLGCT